MVTDGVFREFMQKLDSYFSPKTKLDTVAMDEYRKILSPVGDKFAKTLYSEIVRGHSFFPKILELKTAASRFTTRERYINTKRCYYCMDTGVVPYYKKGLEPFTEFEYAFYSRCTCAAGNNRPDWPVCTSVITQGELEWMFQENCGKFATIPDEDAKAAKVQVQTFVRGFSA